MRELYRRLRADGIDAWLDEENLLPGQDWEFEIPRAVRESDAVIVCLSKGSVNKAGYVQKEIKFALDVADQQPPGAIFLIPLKLDECEVPERLGHWQWVNLLEAKWYDRLLRALHARVKSLGLDRASISFPSPLPALPTLAQWAGMEFVCIPAGKFLMGSDEANTLSRERERPQHMVEIPYDYWMARYPVTNDQFVRFVEEAAYKFSLMKNWQEKANHPVANVSWHDAMEYCHWLNAMIASDIRMMKAQARLPTEAEWEKAARGESGNEWPWGNSFDKTRCNSSEGGKSGTTPVDAYSPQGDSPYGIADLAGNVWEWSVSLWGANDRHPHYGYPYQFQDGRESLHAPDEVLRVLRGGSFWFNAGAVRSAYRYRNDPRNRITDQGFRVVVAPCLS